MNRIDIDSRRGLFYVLFGLFEVLSDHESERVVREPSGGTFCRARFGRLGCARRMAVGKVEQGGKSWETVGSSALRGGVERKPCGRDIFARSATAAMILVGRRDRLQALAALVWNSGFSRPGAQLSRA